MAKLIKLRVHRAIRLALLSATLLAACSSGPVRMFTKGDELTFYDFEEPSSFEEGSYNVATLRVIDGVYRIDLSEGDSEVWWGQWGASLDDVVIDVTVNQLSETNEDAYGVMCRLRGEVGISLDDDPEVALLATASAQAEATAEAEVTDEPEATVEATEAATDEPEASIEATEAATDEPEATADVTAEATDAIDDIDASEIGLTNEVPGQSAANGDGYLFLIQGNGSYSIMRSRGRNLVPLVDWTQTGVINSGPAENEIRAVCMDDYLAMFVNGEFVADVIDDTYTFGQIGLAASSANRLGVIVEFDNLVVSEVEPG